MLSFIFVSKVPERQTILGIDVDDEDIEAQNIDSPGESKVLSRIQSIPQNQSNKSLEGRLSQDRKYTLNFFHITNCLAY